METLNFLIQAVTTVGFPIVCCGAMAWYVKYSTDKAREQMNDITAKHKEEMEKMTEALNNNTIAITKLSAILDVKEL